MDLGGLENLPPFALTGGIGVCEIESLKIDYKFLIETPLNIVL